jgi:hypothetical protein
VKNESQGRERRSYWKLSWETKCFELKAKEKNPLAAELTQCGMLPNGE